MKPKQVALITTVAGAAAGYAAYRWRKAAKREVEMLSGILGWRPGRVVADVGAGRGGMAMAAAKRVGESGHVFATDVEPKRIQTIRNKAARRGLQNITAMQSNLDPECCDAILLRGSYHHFTDPAKMNASLYEALRPGGVLVVIDFPPRRWLSLIAPVKGVPANRCGHGIPHSVLIQEVTAAGFEVEKTVPWFLSALYCVAFRKPRP